MVPTRKEEEKEKEKYLKLGPPSFLPAAKGSARTPLGPKYFTHSLWIQLHHKIDFVQRQPQLF
jgi:hypothetical protein